MYGGEETQTTETGEFKKNLKPELQTKVLIVFKFD